MKIKIKEAPPADREVVAVFLPGHDSCAGGDDCLYIKGTNWNGNFMLPSNQVADKNTWELVKSHALNAEPSLKNWTPIYEGDTVEITF